MLNAQLIRTTCTPDRTLGTFTLRRDGEIIFVCRTCEDPVRGNGDSRTVAQWKVAGSSAIPYGRYQCEYNYSPRYKKNLYQLLAVPGFQGIRIHPGNTEKDTEGCILLGRYLLSNGCGVSDSVVTVQQFYNICSSLRNPPFNLQITC